LLLREAERSVGICARLAGSLTDRRDPSRIEHSLVEMIKTRALAICCGYEDGNDLDRLRGGPAPEAGRRPLPRERRRPVLAIDHEPAGEHAEPQAGGAHDRGADRPVLRIGPGAARRDHARHRRHARHRARRPAAHLYEKVYCARGQAENLIKLHKAQLASDRTSCHSATANQVRLVLHTAAYWIMHALRSRLPATSPLARAEFATLRQRLIKIGARVIEHAARIRVHLPTSCPERSVFADLAAAFMSAAPS
jgi:hypothetical protein